MKKNMVMTYAWLLPALCSSHHMYQNKNMRHLWARPALNKQKICGGCELLVNSRNDDVELSGKL